ncbi:Di-copper centre-containing protein [Penicillium angulare]|uniref:Di-copper centre-containing protein n=1 Tax=Penicillium angulare TaxID=116970 RepID=UPI0025425A33|nr:Di-copper centre-containing protein [Penicillium angulare]KAJ5290822.1 Di-copper centre-containing protein [Penicillium angulare]
MYKFILHLLTVGLLALQISAIPTNPQNNIFTHQKAPSTLSAPSSSIAIAAIQLEKLAKIALEVTSENIANPIHKSALNKDQECTKNNLHVRRNWRSFSSVQKKKYINSVLCLQSKPARTPSHLAPGAKTRYDDFVATHINQTLGIHFTGTFLAWHRYFIYEFEQALRNECGYVGDYPYWDWGADTSAMEKSPVFDGSSTSLSGNGAYIPNEGNIILSLGSYAPVILPRGTGGGCITSGPFKNYKLHLGPAALSLPGGNMSIASNPLNYNPRCLKRDLTSALLQSYANYTSIVSLILENNDIWDFEMVMQGVPGSGAIGVHGGGHYSMGGDPGRDVYVSPGDPAFWLHHGMIDRVWWIWQNLDLERRQNAISGTGTFLNEPPSGNTTLDTIVDVGYANGRPIAMKELMSTTAGPFCYVYV